MVRAARSPVLGRRCSRTNPQRRSVRLCLHESAVGPSLVERRPTRPAADAAPVPGGAGAW